MTKEKKAGMSQQLFLVLFLATMVVGSWKCTIEYVSWSFWKWSQSVESNIDVFHACNSNDF